MLVGQGSVSDEYSGALSTFVDKKYFRKYYDAEDREKHYNDKKAQVGALTITKCHVFFLSSATSSHSFLSGTIKTGLIKILKL